MKNNFIQLFLTNGDFVISEHPDAIFYLFLFLFFLINAVNNLKMDSIRVSHNFKHTVKILTLDEIPLCYSN